MKWLDRIKDVVLGDNVFIGEGNTLEEARADARAKALADGYTGKSFKHEVWCDDCQAWVKHLSICPHK